MYRFLLASFTLAIAFLTSLESVPAQKAAQLAAQLAAQRPASSLAAQVQKQKLFANKNIEHGWKAAVSRQKPLLVMFTSDNCVYCKKMLKETYRHPAIEKMLVGNTESVLAHANDYQALVKKLGIRGYPSSILIAPDGKVLDFMEGYVDPRAFAKRVHPLLQKRTAQVASKDPAVAVGLSGR